MLTKLVDGCFFFLIFKVCQKIWDSLGSNEHKLTSTPIGADVEALELLANRFDHFEDLLFRYLEAEK